MLNNLVHSQTKGEKSKPSESTNVNKEEARVNQPSTAEVSASTDTSNITSLYQNPANGERSFIMLKPDAVQRGLIGKIISRFETKGFKLIAMKVMQASKELLERHYADLSKKPFFPELIR